MALDPTKSYGSGGSIVREYSDIPEILKDKGYTTSDIRRMNKSERIAAIKDYGYTYDPQANLGNPQPTILLPASPSKEYTTVTNLDTGEVTVVKKNPTKYDRNPNLRQSDSWESTLPPRVVQQIKDGTLVLPEGTQVVNGTIYVGSTSYSTEQFIDTYKTVQAGLAESKQRVSEQRAANLTVATPTLPAQPTQPELYAPKYEPPYAAGSTTPQTTILPLSMMQYKYQPGTTEPAQQPQITQSILTDIDKRREASVAAYFSSKVDRVANETARLNYLSTKPGTMTVQEQAELRTLTKRSESNLGVGDVPALAVAVPAMAFYGAAKGGWEAVDMLAYHKMDTVKQILTDPVTPLVQMGKETVTNPVENVPRFYAQAKVIGAAGKAAKATLPRLTIEEVTIGVSKETQIAAGATADTEMAMLNQISVRTHGLETPRVLETFDVKNSVPIVSKIVSKGETEGGAQFSVTETRIGTSNVGTKVLKEDLAADKGMFQPVERATAKVVDKIIEHTPEERARYDSFDAIAKRVQSEKGMPVKDFVVNIEGVKDPVGVTRITEELMAENQGVYFGSLVSKQLPKEGGIELPIAKAAAPVADTISPITKISTPVESEIATNAAPKIKTDVFPTQTNLKFSEGDYGHTSIDIKRTKGDTISLFHGTRNANAILKEGLKSAQERGVGGRILSDGSQFTQEPFVSLASDIKVAKAYAGETGQVLLVEIPRKKFFEMYDNLEIFEDTFSPPSERNLASTVSIPAKYIKVVSEGVYEKIPANQITAVDTVKPVDTAPVKTTITEGFQNRKQGDIDVMFPDKTVEQIKPIIKEYEAKYQAIGEDIEISPQGDGTILQFKSGEKFLEAKSGINQETLGLDDAAPAGVRGYKFANLKAGQVGRTVPFGKAKAITAGEQTLRKGAGSLIVSPGKAAGETASFSEVGVLGKQGNPRGLKDTAGFIQQAKGIAAKKSNSWNPIERLRAKKISKEVDKYFESYTPEQQADIVIKLKDMINEPEKVVLDSTPKITEKPIGQGSTISPAIKTSIASQGVASRTLGTQSDIPDITSSPSRYSVYEGSSPARGIASQTLSRTPSSTSSRIASSGSSFSSPSSSPRAGSSSIASSVSRFTSGSSGSFASSSSRISSPGSGRSSGSSGSPSARVSSPSSTISPPIRSPSPSPSSPTSSVSVVDVSSPVSPSPSSPSSRIVSPSSPSASPIPRASELPRSVPPRIPTPFLSMSDNDEEVKGYNVYMRERGKTVKANQQPLPRKEAEALGRYVADNTVSASFRVTPTRYEVPRSRRATIGTGNVPETKFSESKKHKGWFNEKRSHRIDSEGEKKGLTAAKFISTLRREATLGWKPGRFKI